jgi:sugar phosphate isomerase/epimerase
MYRKIGINSNAYGRLDVARQTELFRENGFEAFFTGSEDPLLDDWMTALRGAGIVCETLHAPFNAINDMWREGEAGERMLARLTDGVTKCEKYGIPALIVHLSSGLRPPRVNDLGLDRFGRLMDAAAAAGVKICYENQRMIGNIGCAFDCFPEARFCWDTGHEACFTPGRRYMNFFGNRLFALHVQDNHGEFDRDEHLIPGDGTLDLGRVARSICEAGFTGSIMLEIIRANSKFYEDVSPEEYYRRAGRAAAELRDLCDRLDRFVV